MPLSGNVRVLAKLKGGLEFIASKQAHVALAKNFAEAAVTEIKLGFAEGVDPEGEAWAPLKKRVGMILRDSGQLGRFRRTRSDAGGFTVATAASYGIYHQTGTSRMPARKMVPEGTLPERYRRAFEEVEAAFVTKLFGP